jgi:hypothetical protein
LTRQSRFGPTPIMTPGVDQFHCWHFKIGRWIRTDVIGDWNIPSSAPSRVSPFLEDVSTFLPLGSKRTAMDWEAVAYGAIEDDLRWWWLTTGNGGVAEEKKQVSKFVDVELTGREGSGDQLLRGFHSSFREPVKLPIPLKIVWIPLKEIEGHRLTLALTLINSSRTALMTFLEETWASVK